jgi:hypothetical protein
VKDVHPGYEAPLSQYPQPVRAGLLGVLDKLIDVVSGVRIRLKMNAEMLALPSLPGERCIHERGCGEPCGVIWIEEGWGSLAPLRHC